MKNIQRAVALTLAILLLTTPAAMSQAKPQGDWAIFQRLTPGEKLSVELKDGKKVKGEFSASTDTTFTLSTGKGSIDLARNDLRKVYLVFGKSIGATTLKGTLIGSAGGAALGAGMCGGSGNFCSNPAGGALVGAVIFAIPGAVAGLLVGALGRHRQLIYEA